MSISGLSSLSAAGFISQPVGTTPATTAATTSGAPSAPPPAPPGPQGPSAPPSGATGHHHHHHGSGTSLGLPSDTTQSGTSSAGSILNTLA
jgi:hypothetical protein